MSEDITQITVGISYSLHLGSNQIIRIFINLVPDIITQLLVYERKLLKFVLGKTKAYALGKELKFSSDDNVGQTYSTSTTTTNKNESFDIGFIPKFAFMCVRYFVDDINRTNIASFVLNQLCRAVSLPSGSLTMGEINGTMLTPYYAWPSEYRPGEAGRYFTVDIFAIT